MILEVEPQFRQSPDLLDKIYVKSSTGQPVPLSAFATMRVSNTPFSIPHQGQFPAATISFNLRSGSSLSHAIPAIQKAEQRNRTARHHCDNLYRCGSGIPFVAHQRAVPDFRCRHRNLHRPRGSLRELHPSDHDSLDAALAGVGALLALLICRIDFSLVALIGIILLIGIVKKNAIMMIDFALDAERREGLSPEESIYQACLLRFRPIMMTTAAALLGALPLASKHGPAANCADPWAFPSSADCSSPNFSPFTLPR